MKTRISVLGMAFVMALMAAGCGGGSTSDGAEGESAGATAFDDTTAAFDTVQTAETASDGLLAAYKVEHDPDAVYTIDDLPQQGNFLKLNLEGIDPETLNKIIHRFKTEATVCGAEHGRMVEAVLAVKPECSVTLRVAKNIIREEKQKTARGM